MQVKVSHALAPQYLRRRIHEEAEGFLSYRIADRGGDHSDHRGDRHSEFDAREDVGERVLGRRFHSYDQYGRSELCDYLSDGRLWGIGCLRWSPAVHAVVHHGLLYRQLPGDKRRRRWQG